MVELEANACLRAEIRAAIEAGLPVYAECGGLMYLARTISWRGRTCRMVGAIPGDAVMHDKPVGRGYVELAETRVSPWPLSAGEPHTALRAHEFHYSSLENLDDGAEFAFDVRRGYGIDGKHDGLVYRNVLASYVHRRSVGADDWAVRFVAFVRGVRRSALGSAADVRSTVVPERAHAG